MKQVIFPCFSDIERRVLMTRLAAWWARGSSYKSVLRTVYLALKEGRQVVELDLKPLSTDALIEGIEYGCVMAERLETRRPVLAEFFRQLAAAMLDELSDQQAAWLKIVVANPDLYEKG